MFTPNLNSTSQQGVQQQQGATSTQQSGSSSRIEVPQAKNALNNMKHEIAGELGINLKQGYNGDLTSRQAGYIGGYMVKRLIEQQERAMAGQQ
ncbi:MAG TPA: alpha/beta-type small acid-soluble spore protein [Candidatus Aphodomonas merdavium]|nr:alpha/beta-type small acid-soluble spore protein [Candidatus Aphodomonas merdavium]